MLKLTNIYKSYWQADSEVEILKKCSMLTGVFLTGPAEKAFAGEIEL